MSKKVVVILANNDEHAHQVVNSNKDMVGKPEEVVIYGLSPNDFGSLQGLKVDKAIIAFTGEMTKSKKFMIDCVKRAAARRNAPVIEVLEGELA